MLLSDKCPSQYAFVNLYSLFVPPISMSGPVKEFKYGQQTHDAI